MASSGGTFGSLLSGVAGGTIGGAVVKLYLDDKQYQEGLAKAEVEGEAATGKIGGALGRMKVVGAAAFAVLAVAALQFAKSAISAAIEADQMQLKLANAVANSSKVAGDSITVFQQQAQAIRDVTGVDDDYINANQAMLVTMGLTENQIVALTPLIVDLTAKGFSLEAATKAVGKSVNGSTGGLARMGVIVDKTAAKSDAFGATLDALSVNEGLAAQKAKLEPWVLLRAEFEQMQENVGHQLMPAFMKLVDALIPLAENLLPLLEAAFKVLPPIIDMVTNAVNPLSDALGLLSGNVPSLARSLNDAAGALKLVGINIGDVKFAEGSGGAQAFNDKLNELAKTAGDMSLTDIKTAITQLADETGVTVDVTDEMATSVQQAGLASAKAADDATKLAAAQQKAAEAARAQKEAEQQLAGGLTGLISSVVTMRRDQAALNELRRKGKQNTKEYTDAQLQLFSDQQSVNDAFRSYAQTLDDANVSQAGATRKLEAMGAKLGMTKGEVDGLIDKLGIFGQKLDELNGKQVDVSVTTHYYSDHVNDNGGTPHGSLLGGPPAGGGGGRGGSRSSDRVADNVSGSMGRRLKREGAFT